MKSSRTYWTSLLKELYDDARKNGGIEYIYTLVRVSGIGEGQDRLIILKDLLEKVNLNNDIDAARFCMEVIGCEDIFILLVNLARCSSGGTYSGIPFFHLYTGPIFNRIKPSIPQTLQEVVKTFIKFGKTRFAHSIERIFSNDFTSYLQNSITSQIPLSFKSKIQDCFIFAKTILDIYFRERLSYSKYNKFVKCPRFEVLELLTNDDYGLFGFNMYFSNGSHANFTRTINNTDCINICNIDPVNFQIGILNDLKNEWMVGTKRLYEIGLPGRYNNLGEWKPIVHPADPEHLTKEALSISNDHDVQGAYFYILCTGYNVIEFVVRTTLVLPDTFTTFGDNLHLWKCPNRDPQIPESFQLYDGWVRLEKCSIEHIEATIRGIGLALNIIGFTYSVPIDWRLKYKMSETSEPKAIPTSEDLSILDTMLRETPYEGTEVIVLSYALDWYVRGRTSKNTFMRFLSCYIVIESVASAISEGNVDFGLGYCKESKKERDINRIDGINKLYEQLFKTNPIKFVNDAYFNHVVSLISRTRKVTELVFGKDSKYIEMLFEKTGQNDPSLNEIRGRLAHGDVALFSREDELLVRDHLYEIESISREFLLRLILRISPSDELPHWSGSYKEDRTFVDPRSTHYCTTLDIFSKAEWKIRPEWID